MNLIPIGANQTEAVIGGKTILFSYRTPVAARVGGKVYRTEKHWSVTTTRHINKWLDGAEALERPQAFFDDLAQ